MLGKGGTPLGLAQLYAKPFSVGSMLDGTAC